MTVALFACGVAFGVLAFIFILAICGAAGEQDRPTLYDQDTDQ